MAKKTPGRSPRGKYKQQDGVLGAPAKSLRLRRRMTLESLAERIGVSKGHLSRFERGQKSLSLAVLMRLADALQSSVAELLGEPAAVGKSHLAKAADRTYRKAAAAAGNYTFSALSRADDPLINAFVIDFAPNAEMRKSAEAYHSGEEILFVLRGALEIELGNRKQTISEGDYLQFAGSVRHNIRSIRKRSSVLVVVVQR